MTVEVYKFGPCWYVIDQGRWYPFGDGKMGKSTAIEEAATWRAWPNGGEIYLAISPLTESCL